MNTISHISLQTPLGEMVAGATDAGLCLLEFADRKMLPTEYKQLSKYLDGEFVEQEHPLFIPLRRQLAEYFEGKRREFDILLNAPGTPFQKRAWDELLKIPYGSTRSYKQQAIALGNADSVRAAARANGMNRISIIIPCHRIIGDDGSLTGYGGGLWRKRALLDLEAGQGKMKF